MIFDATCTEHKRFATIEYIKRQGFKRVVDVGGALGPWAHEVVTHYIDLQTKADAYRNDPNTFTKQVEAATFIQADMCNPLTWGALHKEIKANGLFDFIICTQTLEHATNPRIATVLLQMLGPQGFVSVPNKYTELRRGVAMGHEGLARCKVKGHWRGFLPHRWVVTLRNDILWFWPKLPFLEYLEGIDEIVASNTSDIELSFYWRGQLPVKVITDTYIDHPDPEKACDLYRRGLAEGL